MLLLIMKKMKIFKMDKVVPLLIEAIKDQQKQIDELKELITKKIK